MTSINQGLSNLVLSTYDVRKKDTMNIINIHSNIRTSISQQSKENLNKKIMHTYQLNVKMRYDEQEQN